jgi:uncharacterized membrane protein
MSLDNNIPIWLLAFSYWVHLLATVTWLGGLLTMAVVAWPAVRNQVMDVGQWSELLRRFTPWANISLVLLWVTGFLQMSADENYEGLLSINSLWSQAILMKHIAVAGMMVFGLYSQWRLHPALARLAILEQKHPELAQSERNRLSRQESRVLRLNLVFALLVLLFTAIATAV